MSNLHPDFSKDEPAPVKAFGKKKMPTLTEGDVRRIRKYYGETQAQFAKRFEVDTVTVARWENGQRKCAGMYANRIAEIDPLGHTVLRDFAHENAELQAFSNRALISILLAQSEAHRFGSAWTGTEHLLLGLIGEGQGSASFCLQQAGIEFAHAALELERFSGLGAQTIVLEQPFSSRLIPILNLPSEQARFHALTFGIPCSPKFVHVMETATTLAQSHNHSNVNTIHLLGALLESGDNAANEILASIPIDLNTFVETVQNKMNEEEIDSGELTVPVRNTSHASDAIYDSLNIAANALQEAARTAFLWQDYALANEIRETERAIRSSKLQHRSKQIASVI